MSDIKKEIQKGYNTFKVFEHLQNHIDTLVNIENAIQEKQSALAALKKETESCRAAFEKEKKNFEEKQLEAKLVLSDASQKAKELDDAIEQGKAAVNAAEDNKAAIDKKIKDAEKEFSNLQDKIVSETKRLDKIQKQIADTAEKLKGIVAA